MAHHAMVKVSARKGAGKGGKVNKMEIHRVANGFHTMNHHDSAGGEYTPPTENVHTSAAAMCKHVKSTFGDGKAEEAEETEEAA